VEDVSEWLSSTAFSAFGAEFESAKIDGAKLLSLNRTALQHKVKITDVSARNGILKEILSLKRKLRKSNVKALHQTIRRRRVKTYFDGDDDHKSTPNTDHRRTRKYIKIAAISGSAKSAASSIRSVADILEKFKFQTQSDRDLIVPDRCTLKQALSNGFGFIICDSTTSQHFYVLTKHSVKDWSVENVHEVMVQITGSKFKDFADELRRKKVSGGKLVKITPSKIQREFKKHFHSASERKEIMDELTALKTHFVDGFNVKKQAKSTPVLFSPQIENRESRPSVIQRKQLRADRKAERRMMGPRSVSKGGYKGTKMEELDGGGDRRGYQFRSDGFLAERVHFMAKEKRFNKRKKANPVETKIGVAETGVIKGFKGTEFEEKDGGSFLQDRFHPSSKSAHFLKRKEQNPVQRKLGAHETGKISYDGIDYEDDDSLSFLADKVHPQSRDANFQKRKDSNPVEPKKGVAETGTIQYDGTEYVDDDSGGFLEDRIHPNAKAERFNERKKLNPVEPKMGAAETGIMENFDKPEWSDRVSMELKQDNAGGFLQDKSWYDSTRAGDAHFEDGISKILRTIPANKLKPLDDAPLPTGLHTKIGWLQKLRDIIAAELKTEILELQVHLC